VRGVSVSCEFFGKEFMNTRITADEAESLQTEFFGSDLREQWVLSSLTRLLPGHHRFIDVGANIGQYSYFVNNILRDGEIISIEANPDLIKLLQGTVRRAGIESAHGNTFKVVNCAVSDSKGRLSFYVETRTLTTSSIFMSPVNDPGRKTIEVDCMTLDDLFVPGIKTFIKIDVEGAEYRALLGSEQYLASPDTTFLIEVHPWGDGELKRYPLHLCAKMLANGYRMRKLVPHYFFGSHYLFTKSPSVPAFFFFVYYLPVLLAEYLVYRLFPKDPERIVGVLRALFKRSLPGDSPK
jgi:FkbM family methyltransferase